MIYIREDLKGLFKEFRTVDDFLRIKVETVRDFKHRQTGRFELGHKGFYIKKHFEAGIGAVVDELLRLRKPHIGAAHEKSAIERLTELGIGTMRIAAFGQNGAALTKQTSFLITDEIADVESLEDICGRWPNEAPAARFKSALIKEVALIAKTLHENGMNHRDFYVCHFLLDVTGGANEYVKRQPRLFLIDLHRAQQRLRVPFRWRAKDIGGLYFSAMNIGLTGRDMLRFIRFYTGESVRRSLQKDKRFWRAVHHRAIRVYRKEFGKAPAPVIGY
jgi:heptose I phosphotransferase